MVAIECKKKSIMSNDVIHPSHFHVGLNFILYVLNTNRTVYILAPYMQPIQGDSSNESPYYHAQTGTCKAEDLFLSAG